MSAALTPRQQREKEYYEQFPGFRNFSTVNFEPIEGRERRPWNSYWQHMHIVQDLYRPGARILDFGCGTGAASVVFARLGYKVDGFDISEANIAMASGLASKYGFADQTHFSIQVAEKLEYSDDTFDVIAGVDIIHHVDVAPAMRECYRVLKPGGVAVFREPIRSPVFDTVRNLSIVKKLFPNDVSFENHITHDERKLDENDLRAIRSVFADTEISYFRVL